MPRATASPYLTACTVASIPDRIAAGRLIHASTTSTSSGSSAASSGHDRPSGAQDARKSSGRLSQVSDPTTFVPTAVRFAKPAYLERGTAGSNPALSAFTHFQARPSQFWRESQHKLGAAIRPGRRHKHQNIPAARGDLPSLQVGSIRPISNSSDTSFGAGFAPYPPVMDLVCKPVPKVNRSVQVTHAARVVIERSDRRSTVYATEQVLAKGLDPHVGRDRIRQEQVQRGMTDHPGRCG